MTQDETSVGTNDGTQAVIAGPDDGHWFALERGELVCLPMSKGDDPANLPPHPSTLTDDESFRAGWYAVDFYSAFDERDAEDRVRLERIRGIESQLRGPQ